MWVEIPFKVDRKHVCCEVNSVDTERLPTYITGARDIVTDR